MARVIEIVKAHLEANGFDGLLAVGAECACLCEDLAPCASYFGQCEPGYLGVHTEEPGEWAIYRTKAGALDSMAGRCRNEENGMPRKTHDDIKPESQAFRIAMMIASRAAEPARDLERAGLRAPQPVRCESCQWRGRRLTPRRAPCPACGSRVEFA